MYAATALPCLHLLWIKSSFRTVTVRSINITLQGLHRYLSKFCFVLVSGRAESRTEEDQEREGNGDAVPERREEIVPGWPFAGYC